MKSPCWSAALFLGLAFTGGAGVAAKARPHMSPSPLDVVGQDPFDLRGLSALPDDLRCDAQGTVFFVPKGEVEVVRVPAAGAPAQTIQVATALGLEASELHIQDVTADDRGGVQVLVRDALDEDILKPQYIASFDGGGALVGTLRVDRSMLAQWRRIWSFARFGSGEYLFLARPDLLGRRLAVIADSSGQARRPVGGRVSSFGGGAGGLDGGMTAHDATTDAPFPLGRWRTFVTSTANGGVLFARDRDAVYSVSTSGAAERQFHLAPPPSGRLHAIKASGPRLAVVYEDRGDTPSHWVDVYDVASGAQRARYGPIRDGVLCYHADGDRDRFDLLAAQNGQSLVLRATGR